MKKLILLLFLVAGCVAASAQFTDDFSDGDFTANPEWNGDTARFSVNSSRQLRLETTGADTACLVTPNLRVLESQWDFWLKMSFNTSANNYCRFYLASDQPSIKGPLNGYFLQAGGSKDSVTFYRQEGNNVTPLMKGAALFTGNSTNILRIRIIHEDNGLWRLLADPSGSTNLVEQGTCTDTSVNTSSWSGIFCRFTSSNSAKFFFDDISCTCIIDDTIPPVVETVIVIDDFALEVTFSEAPDSNDATNAMNYHSSEYGYPSNAKTVIGNPQKIILDFSSAFKKEFLDTLEVRNIRDQVGNMMDVAAVTFFRNDPDPYEILINEIMADPDPSFGLPLSEYLELYNTGQLPAYLEGWKLEYGSSSKVFPGIIIPSGGFLIITKGDYMNPFGPSLDLFTSSSSLSNEGTAITLRDQSGHVIHSISYKKEWHENMIKEDGGWSLEMIDAANPCGCSENWTSSADLSGGSPGRVNSVTAANPDTAAPYIKGFRIDTDSAFNVVFSEPMDTTHQCWWYLDDEPIGEAAFAGPSFREANISLTYPLIRGMGYTLTRTGELSDCAGNALTESGDPVVALPDTAGLADLVINEVLPDPETDGERFIEVYNRSDKIIDLADVIICTWDSVSGSFGDLKNISEGSLLFFPGKYLVLTNDPEDIATRYFCPENVFIELSSMPSMTNDYGDLILARKHDGVVIDRMQYSSGMHFPLLNDISGVSLEKINPCVSSLDPGSWHSASSSCGYATPGYRNSQFTDSSARCPVMTVIPEVFSPDNDGRQDLLCISIFPGKVAAQCSIVIFDEEGRMVKKLANNRLAGEGDMLFWDGTTNDNKKAAPGIYVVYLEMLYSSGEIIRQKQVAGLAP